MIKKTRQPRISRRRLVMGGLLAGAGILGGSSKSGAQQRRTIRIAATNLVSHSPVFMAKSLGYFAEEGLDVDVVESASGNATVSALVSGSVEVASAGYIIPFQLAERGLRVKIVVGELMRNLYVFVVRPSLDVPPDDPVALANALRGKRFGVSNIGSAGDTVASGVLADHGSRPGDIVKVAVGVGGTALAALRSGAVDGLITYEPDLTQIVRSGAGKIALDLRSTTRERTYSRLPSVAVQAQSAWIDRNPDIAARVVRAVVRANNILRVNPETSLNTWASLYPNMEAVDLRSMYEGERGGFRSPVTREDFEFAQDMYIRMNAITRRFSYEEMTATQFAPLWT